MKATKSATLPREFNESYPATAASVARARRAVSHFAAQHGIAGEELDAVRLAVSEAVTNVVVHAYPGQTGSVHVTAAAARDELWVLVADDGRGHQTSSATPGLGMGLMLIAQLATEYVITERACGGTEVRMQFTLPPAGPPGNG